MIFTLLITTLTVSIDSFFCGFSLAYIKGKKAHIVLGISLTVFAMCLLTNYLSTLLPFTIDEKTTSFGGLILISIGLYNLFSRKKINTQNNKILFVSIITGFAVGIDGALSNLSLSLMGINAFYVPLSIAMAHAFFIVLGILLANTKTFFTLKKLDFIPPIVLMILGVFKVFSALI